MPTDAATWHRPTRPSGRPGGKGSRDVDGCGISSPLPLLSLPEKLISPAPCTHISSAQVHCPADPQQKE
eukprot:365085-Chlamydomonas_euryale.AAC.5